TQLGKYNEALSQHREKLKTAVDDETNSWKALAKASEVAFEDATRGLDEQYEKRRTNYEKDANAFRYYVRKETDTFIVEEKRQADAKKFSEKAMLQATNAIVIEESTAKLAETNRYLGQALALSQKEYQTKIDNAKRLKLDANRIDEERLQNQRRILERVEAAYRQNIDKLIAEEKRHRDAAKQLAEERKNFNESVSDRIQNIAEKGMDPVQVYASRQRRIVQEQAQAEKALQQGNYELARKHAEKMISLAEQTSDEVKQGDMVVVGSKAAAARSIEQMQKAAKIENQAFREEADAHTKAADSLKEKSETAEKALAKIRDAVQEVDAALAKDHTMIINANIENIRQAGKEIDALLEKKERVVQIKAELQGGATALESMVGDVLKGATSKAQASLDEVSRVFTKFKAEFSGWQPEIKATFDAVSANGSIDGLMAKFNDFKNTVPPEYKVAFLGNADQAVAEIDGLIMKINEIPLERTVLINYVEKRSSTDGTSQGFARGGFLPGWGTKDDVPALLQKGEFVLRKEAVRFYGLDRILAMNQMRMKPVDIPRFAFGGLVRAIDAIRFKMPDIPRFEFGGVVRNLVIPTVPQVALAGGGAVPTQVAEVIQLNLSINDRPKASITAPRADIRGIVSALRELERGMR
ncbi:MAG: hypothetical protein HQL74_16290, partial [Magnetococcales bacterium]|nr:hypothetical protein [Magnetococcales bacterium]